MLTSLSDYTLLKLGWRSWTPLMVAFGVGSVLAVALVNVDAMDHFYHFSRSHEEWELDELVVGGISMIISALVALTWILYDHHKRFVQLLKEHRVLEEQQLRARKLQALSTLFGGASHSLNNLMQPIVSLTELALDDMTPQDPNQPLLVEVSAAAKEAKALVRDMLSLSRQDHLTLRPVEMAKLLNDQRRLLEALIPSSMQLAWLVPASGLGRVMADAGQVQSALLNMVSNAVDAIDSATSGRIEIAAERANVDEDRQGHLKSANHNHYVRILLSDNGVGMDAQTLERIFEPFFTTKEVGEGSGLGMSIALGVVESHDGLLFVDSQPGVGTTFSLYLPTLEH
ncbi:sensor histidine kinase [Magnetofaba australis]|uniref:histidine kinase n=1 Tax=Magnetofaba australis IT-1 TaxID=1434232 RepID=A0A1Y2K097_9PROT|nr:ATP-binding protein [Magnetofaba australis]OSM00163.1 putative Sensor protein ZraS [Magnetofaba australis IT-1]